MDNKGEMYMTKAEMFAGLLSSENREFFLEMNEILGNEGLIITHSNNRITYFPDTNRKNPLELKKQQPLVLRYTIDENGELIVELKLNFIDCYADLIEKMPEHIKMVFRSISRCGACAACKLPRDDGYPNCGIRRVYVIDGEHYYSCSYKFYYHIDISNPDDVEYYAKIIESEVSAAKARKKHRTI